MNKKNGTLISFVGSRGSGKTTIAQLVCAELEQCGYTCLRQHQGLARRPFFKNLTKALYLWRFFDLETMRALGFYGRTPRRKPSLYRLYLPLAFAHDLHKLARKDGDVLVYDSNVFRGLAAAAGRGEIGENFISDFYSRKVLSKVRRVVLVVVETDPEEAVARWIERDDVELTDDEFSAEIAQRAQVQRTTEMVVGAIEKLPEVSVVRLDGEMAPEENAKHVVRAAGFA